MNFPSPQNAAVGSLGTIAVIFWNEEILQIQSAPRAFAALRKDGAVFAWGDQTSGWDGMKRGVVLIESCFFVFGFRQTNVGPKISVFP